MTSRCSRWLPPPAASLTGALRPQHGADAQDADQLLHARRDLPRDLEARALLARVAQFHDQDSEVGAVDELELFEIQPHVLARAPELA